VLTIARSSPRPASACRSSDSPAPARRRGAIRDRKRQPEQGEDGANQAFGPSQREVVDSPHSKRSRNRDVGEGAAPRWCPPAGNHVGRYPARSGTPAHEHPVVGGPVASRVARPATVPLTSTMSRHLCRPIPCSQPSGSRTQARCTKAGWTGPLTKDRARDGHVVCEPVSIIGFSSEFPKLDVLASSTIS
jgi:hypothetical protein